MAPNQTILSVEAGGNATPQVEKALNDAEVPEEKKIVNESEAEVATGMEKKKRSQRERKRERKRQANSKEAPAATAGMKKQGVITTEDSYTTYICNLLKQAGKQVIFLVKDTFEKTASKAARVTEYKRTPKRIRKWRAQVPNSDHKRIVKLRSQLANEALPDGTTAVCFTPA